MSESPSPGAHWPDIELLRETRSTVDAPSSGGASPVENAPMLARLEATLRAGHLDRMLAVGAPVLPGSAIAVHATRITSAREREAIGGVLLRAIRESVNPPLPSFATARLPVHRANIVSAGVTLDVITLRLHSPRRVAARGMARLRMLLSDGVGPFYEFGRGDLEGRLGAALAAL